MKEAGSEMDGASGRNVGSQGGRKGVSGRADGKQTWSKGRIEGVRGKGEREGVGKRRIEGTRKHHALWQLSSLTETLFTAGTIKWQFCEQYLPSGIKRDFSLAIQQVSSYMARGKCNPEKK